MSDLINRQDAIYALTEANLKNHMDSVEGGQENRSAIRIIMELPSAERKRAIWMPIERGDKGYSAGDFICSCCGKPNKCYSITDYCCSCGAKMERKRRKDVRESN